jgi:hypothetical protein
MLTRAGNGRSIIGLSAGIDITKHWALTVEGDIGGFGVGSDFTWNALGLISYRTSVFVLIRDLARLSRSLVGLRQGQF